MITASLATIIILNVLLLGIGLVCVYLLRSRR